MTRWIPLFALAGLSACSSSSTDDTKSTLDTDGGVASDAPAGDAPTADAATDAGVVCPAPAFTDSLRADRTSCTFAAGAKVAETLAVPAAARAAIPIKHVVVVMKENRSYDEYFGQLPAAGQPDAEGPPADWGNPDSAGASVKWFHQTTTCAKPDPGHQWTDMHAQSNGGKMDGFVTAGASSSSTDGHFVMGYYDATDLPFYYFLANTYAVGDHHFPSVLSGTWPNRDYLLCGTSDGTKATGNFPFPAVPTVFDSLDAAGVTWGEYTDGNPFEFALGWPGDHPGVHKFADLLSDLAKGTLPQVVFVDSKENAQDEHPPADVQVGEAWTKSLYDAAVASPLWSNMAIFLTWDEAGGFADHVPPPAACAPDDKDTEFTELGIRVPLLVLSPYAKRHFVSHAVHEHTSILRFIELLYDLPALTARDANSDAMLDMFDFDCPDKTAIPAAPAAGTGGCK